MNHKFDDAEEQRILAVDPNLWKYLPQISVNEIIKDASKLEECKCVDKFSMQNWEDIVNAYPTFKSNEYYQRFFPPTRSRKSVSIKPSTRVKIPELDKKIIKKLERKYQTSMMDDSIKILLPPFNEDENIFLNWKALLPP